MEQLSLPIVYITEKYKAGNCRTVMMLRFSSDIEIRDNPLETRAYRKWKVEAAVDNAIKSLDHRDIIVAVQVGRSGLGSRKFTSFCSSTNKQKRNAVIKETRRVEISKATFQMGEKSSRAKVELERALVVGTCSSKLPD